MTDSKIRSYKIACQQMKQSILNHESCPLDQIEGFIKDQMDKEMVELIQSYNDELCKLDHANTKTTYSDLLEKNKFLEARVCTLQYQLDEINKKASRYYKQIQTLRQESLFYERFQEEVFDVVNRQKSKNANKTM